MEAKYIADLREDMLRIDVPHDVVPSFEYKYSPTELRLVKEERFVRYFLSWESLEKLRTFLRTFHEGGDLSEEVELLDRLEKRRSGVENWDFQGPLEHRDIRERDWIGEKLQRVHDLMGIAGYVVMPENWEDIVPEMDDIRSSLRVSDGAVRNAVFELTREDDDVKVEVPVVQGGSLEEIKKSGKGFFELWK